MARELSDQSVLHFSAKCVRRSKQRFASCKTLGSSGEMVNGGFQCHVPEIDGDMRKETLYVFPFATTSTHVLNRVTAKVWRKS